MSSFFNPASPRFRRGVQLLSIYSCTLVAAHVVIADFGTQEHIFSPIQRVLFPRIDAYFGITEDEIRPSVKSAQVQEIDKEVPAQVVAQQPPLTTTTGKTEVVPRKRGWLW
jgi:hypothetical protein